MSSLVQSFKKTDQDVKGFIYINDSDRKGQKWDSDREGVWDFDESDTEDDEELIELSNSDTELSDSDEEESDNGEAKYCGWELTFPARSVIQNPDKEPVQELSDEDSDDRQLSFVPFKSIEST